MSRLFYDASLLTQFTNASSERSMNTSVSRGPPTITTPKNTSTKIGMIVIHPSRPVPDVRMSVP